MFDPKDNGSFTDWLSNHLLASITPASATRSDAWRNAMFPDALVPELTILIIAIPEMLIIVSSINETKSEKPCWFLLAINSIACFSME